MVSNDHIEYQAILHQWEKGHAVDIGDLVNALAWNRQNQRRALARLEEACKTWREGNDEKQARIAELEAALRKYGHHAEGCDFLLDTLPCTCGFEALRATLEVPQ